MMVTSARFPWVVALVPLVQWSPARAPSSATENATVASGPCQPIAIPFCAGLPYRHTAVPNLLGHAGQTEAGYEMHAYTMFRDMGCSHDLKTFLCAVFAPACTATGRPAPPCRPLCTSARNGCESAMARLGQPWPVHLECSRFPERHSGGDPATCYSGGNPWTGDPFDYVAVAPSSDLGTTSGTGTEDGGDPVVCDMPCDAFWSPEQTRTARRWVATWSAVTAAACLLACCTFAADTGRFPYPERPVVYMSLCHLAVAASHLVGCLFDGGARHNPLCTALFVAAHFFGTASTVWWIVFSLTWYLAAGLTWGREAIDVHSRHFHLAAWTVSAAHTVAALRLGEIQGDVLSGVCSVAACRRSDDTAARDMVLIPSVVYLVAGVTFWTADSVALFRIRRTMKRDGAPGTGSLERHVARVGVFNALYVLPAAARVSCLVYEHVNAGHWTIIPAVGCPGFSFRETYGPGTRPCLWMSIAKHIASLQVGIAPCVWMLCSGKTLNCGWRRPLARVPRDHIESGTRV